LLEREVESLRRRTDKRMRIAAAVEVAKREARRYASSEEGAKEFEEEASRRAEEMLAQREMDQTRRKKSITLADREAVLEERYLKRRELLAKRAAEKIGKLQTRRLELLEALRALPEGSPALSEREASIASLGREIQELRERRDIQTLDAKFKKNLARLREDRRAGKLFPWEKVGKRRAARGARAQFVREITEELVDEYVAAAAKEAKRQARREQRQFARVFRNWRGVGLRETFFAWKVWYRRCAKQRRRDERARIRAAKEAYKASLGALEVARWRVGKYERDVNEWTDEVSYVHVETGERRTKTPTLETLLPPNFFHDLVRPPEMDLETPPSSEESDSNFDSEDDVSSSDATDLRDEDVGADAEDTPDRSLSGTEEDLAGVRSELPIVSKALMPVGSSDVPSFGREDLALPPIVDDLAVADFEGMSTAEEAITAVENAKFQQQLETALADTAQISIPVGSAGHFNRVALSKELSARTRAEREEAERLLASMRQIMLARREQRLDQHRRQMKPDSDPSSPAAGEATSVPMDVLMEKLDFDPNKMYTERQLLDFARRALEYQRSLGVTANAGFGDLVMDGVTFGRNDNSRVQMLRKVLRFGKRAEAVDAAAEPQKTKKVSLLLAATAAR